jgi:hypothetical protein
MNGEEHLVKAMFHRKRGIRGTPNALITIFSIIKLSHFQCLLRWEGVRTWTDGLLQQIFFHVLMGCPLALLFDASSVLLGSMMQVVLAQNVKRG